MLLLSKRLLKWFAFLFYFQFLLLISLIVAFLFYVCPFFFYLFFLNIFLEYIILNVAASFRIKHIFLFQVHIFIATILVIRLIHLLKHLIFNLWLISEQWTQNSILRDSCVLWSTLPSLLDLVLILIWFLSFLLFFSFKLIFIRTFYLLLFICIYL